MTEQYISSCCSQPVQAVTADEGTSYYECSQCKQPCNFSTPTHTKETWSERFDKRFAHKFHIAEHDSTNYSGLGVQVDGEWERIKDFISQELYRLEEEHREKIIKLRDSINVWFVTKPADEDVFYWEDGTPVLPDQEPLRERHNAEAWQLILKLDALITKKENSK